MKVYLAGPINGTSWDECYKWRSDAADILAKHGIEALDPLSGKEVLEGSAKIIGSTRHFNYKEIIERDLWHIRQADIVLVNATRGDCRYIGTTCEVFYANYVLNKPVVVFYGDNVDWMQSWMNYLITRSFTKMEDAIDYIARYWRT